MLDKIYMETQTNIKLYCTIYRFTKVSTITVKAKRLSILDATLPITSTTLGLNQTNNYGDIKSLHVCHLFSVESSAVLGNPNILSHHIFLNISYWRNLNANLVVAHTNYQQR